MNCEVAIVIPRIQIFSNVQTKVFSFNGGCSLTTFWCYQKSGGTWQDYWCIIVLISTEMASRSAYVHLYWKFFNGIFHITMENFDVENIPLYHHQKEILQMRARSNSALMFAWWWDLSNPTWDTRRTWWQTIFNEHHSPKGARCQVLVANYTQGCTTSLSILQCLRANRKSLTYPNSKVDDHVPNSTIHEIGFGFHWPD